MSWNKNTVMFSEVDAVMRTLQELETPYTLEVIDSFRGMGLNDYDGDAMYDLRRLQYADTVILEYVELDLDCDTDDCILSTRFILWEVPNEWEAIRHTDKWGECEQ